jgi:membrane associated rhomboid family serine protease
VADKPPPRSPLRWLFDASLLLLGAALAINWAIGLISQVWAGILIAVAIAGVIAGVIAGLIVWWRIRRRRW